MRRITMCIEEEFSGKVIGSFDLTEYREKARAEVIEEVKKELIDIIQGNEEFIDWQKEEICFCIECAIENVLKQKGE